MTDLANPPSPAATAADRRTTHLALLAAMAFFMENLDATVLVTALPGIATSFGGDAIDMSSAVTAYLLALGVFIPVSGWAADRVGPRDLFARAVLVFVGASVACALSTSLAQMVVARGVQGMAGAMMVPVARLVVLRAADRHDLLRVIAYISWPGLIAPVIGPAVGGFLATYASWRWIFVLNVPLGLVGYVAARRLLPGRDGSPPRPFDARGFLLVGGACVGLLASTELLTHPAVPASGALALLLGAGGLAVLAARHLRRAAAPLIDLRALDVPGFRVSMRGGSAFRAAIAAVPFLVPLLFQSGFGMTPFRAGSLLLAVFAGNVLMKSATNVVLRRFGFRPVLLVNGVLVIVSIAACAAFTRHTSVVAILLVLFAGGVFRSLQFTGLSALSFATVPKALMGAASTFSSIVIPVSMGLGVALGALLVRLATAAGIGGGDPATPLRLVLLAAAALALPGLVDLLRLPADAGRAVTGPEARRPSARPLRPGPAP